MPHKFKHMFRVQILSSSIIKSDLQLIVEAPLNSWVLYSLNLSYNLWVFFGSVEEMFQEAVLHGIPIQRCKTRTALGLKQQIWKQTEGYDWVLTLLHNKSVQLVGTDVLT